MVYFNLPRVIYFAGGRLDKFRNISLCIIVSIFLCGPALLFGATSAGIELPTYMTADSARYLTGTTSHANLAANTNIRAFLEKSFQPAAEKKIGENVPFKGTTMLGNAAAQRASITLANAPFGFDSYPTYYGCEYLYIASADAITYPVEKKRKSTYLGWDWFAENLVAYAQKHPDKRFVILFPCGASYTAIHPAHELIADSLSGKMAADYVSKQIPNIENVYFFTDAHSYASATEYYEYYYRTDHHWNILGAQKVWGEAESALSLPAVDFGSLHDISGFKFHGSMSRLGLDMVEEDVFDCTNTFDNVQMVLDDGSIKLASDHSDFYNDMASHSYNFYEDYYSVAPAYRSDGKGKALIISDSYGNILNRPIASIYETTLRYPAMAYDAKGYSLDELLAQSEANDVYFIATPGNYSTLKKRSPKFFE